MIDIANQANVSRMAVSAVLMGTGKGSIRISVKKSDEIRKIASELGYQPNIAAQQLAGKKSGIIAAMANNWFYPVEMRMFSWLQQSFNEEGYRVLATQSNGQIEPIKNILSELKGRGVEGLLYVAFGNEQEWSEVINLLKGIPHVVSILGDLGAPQISSVLSDSQEGAALAVRHLTERGRKKIVMIVENETSQMNRRRIQGFKNEHHKLGLKFSEDQICIATEGWELESTSYEEWDNLLVDVLGRKGTDGLVADSDFGAVGLLKAIRRKGVSVPEEISLVGWGNETIAPLFDPAISTVSYQLGEIISTAAKTLIKQINSGQQSDSPITRVKPKLIIRETS